MKDHEQNQDPIQQRMQDNERYQKLNNLMSGLDDPMVRNTNTAGMSLAMYGNLLQMAKQEKWNDKVDVDGVVVSNNRDSLIPYRGDPRSEHVERVALSLGVLEQQAEQLRSPHALNNYIDRVQQMEQQLQADRQQQQQRTQEIARSDQNAPSMGARSTFG